MTAEKEIIFNKILLGQLGLFKLLLDELGAMLFFQKLHHFIDQVLILMFLYPLKEIYLTYSHLLLSP